MPSPPRGAALASLRLSVEPAGSREHHIYPTYPICPFPAPLPRLAPITPCTFGGVNELLPRGERVSLTRRQGLFFPEAKTRLALGDDDRLDISI